MRKVCFTILAFLTLLGAVAVEGQPVAQNPAPMTDATRPHPRIAKVEVPGRRVELAALKGSVLFAGAKVDPKRAVPLIIHFHGVSWLIEHHIAKHFPKAALITVNLGSGSRVYGEPFGRAEQFQELIDEAAKSLELKKGWSTITLVGFSAGYGAIRAILRHEPHFDQVNNVLLLDGIHASYAPEGKRLADGGVIRAEDVDAYAKLAREAAAGRKQFFISHSEISPGTYASTTECVDVLLATLGLKRKAKLRQGPAGMQQLSEVDVKGFHIRGYAGDTAPDHVDHLHAMPHWLKELDVR